MTFALLFTSLLAAAPRLTVPTFQPEVHAVVGRYVFVDYVVQNPGPGAMDLPPLCAVFIGPGAPAPIAVAPPHWEPPAPLAAGTSRRVIGYARLKSPGTFSFALHLGPAAKPGDALTGTQTLHVVAAGDAPQAAYWVNDTQPRHVYRAGETIHVDVMPLPQFGRDLRGDVDSFTVTTAVKPFSSTAKAKAHELLTESAGRTFGYEVDFYGTPEAQHTVTLAASFAQPRLVSAVRLDGCDLNSYYTVRDPSLVVVDPTGAEQTIAMRAIKEGNRWTLYAPLAAPANAKSLRLSLSTPYKINLTALALRGADPGQPACQVTAGWVDGDGKALGYAQNLPLFQPQSLALPVPQPGYRGLRLTTQWGPVTAQTDYGFVILPTDRATGPKATDPRLGLVHMDINDPFLGAGGSKTLTTPFYDSAAGKLDAAAWQRAMAERSALGLTELPMVIGDEWGSSGTEPVPAAQLAKLGTKMAQYFRATPDLPAWELGIEENLAWRGHRDTWKQLWPNLDAKAAVVRKARDDAGVKTKLAYQVAELDLRSLEDFLASPAAARFEILSLHPYAWPNFGPPEQWLPEFLGHVHALMTKYHHEMPIWFTEIGAPDDGNPGGFLGYPDIAAYVRGLDRAEYGQYLVKCHLLALSLGVEKVYWYNYRDRGSDPEYAEDHFAMADSRGFPKPGYAAYGTLAAMLRGRTVTALTTAPAGVKAFRLSGPRGEVVVAWAWPGTTARVTAKDLGLGAATVTSLTGAPVPVDGGQVVLGSAPVYLASK